jgi:hypothetical protein
MAGECGDLVDVPSGTSEVRQTEMAKRVCAESLDLSSPREFEDDLRPTPDRDRFRIVAVGL